MGFRPFTQPWSAAVTALTNSSMVTWPVGTIRPARPRLDARFPRRMSATTAIRPPLARVPEHCPLPKQPGTDPRSFRD